MEIEFQPFAGGAGVISVEQFADTYGLKLIVIERPKAIGLARFYVCFDGVEIGGNGILSSASGNGNTPTEALIDYCSRIAGHHLVKDAYMPTRAEFDAPNAFSPVLPNLPNVEMDPIKAMLTKQ